MDLNLKNDQVFSALLLLAVQNNIALKSLSKTLIEYIAEKDGEDMADKFLEILNEARDETQKEVLLFLKSRFGDVDDIDLNKLFGE